MSESRGRLDGLGDEALLDATLAAVERPALVCDRAGHVVAYNDRLTDRTAATASTLADATLDAVVDCEAPLLDRAFDGGGDGGGGDAVTGAGTVAVDGAALPCRVTCRPFGGAESAGAVVTLVIAGDSDADAGGGADAERDSDVDWPLVAASAGDEGEYAYVVDTDGVVRALGDEAVELADRSRAALVGEDVAVLSDAGVLTDDAVTELRDRIEALVATDRDGMTFNARPGADGRERVVEHRLTALEHRGETVGAIGRTHDVTERVQSTAALRESHNRLATIVENLPVIMFVVSHDGTVEHYQGKGIDRIPYDREEILGANIDVFEAEFPDVYDGTTRALDGEFVEETVSLDDRTFKCFFEPLDDPEDPSEMIGTAVDITERTQRERELAEINERLDLALDSTDAGVYVWYIGQDRVYWHETTSELFGLDPETTERSPEVFREHVHPDHEGEILEATERAIEGDGHVSVEYRIVRSDGEVRWMVTEGDVEYRDGDPHRLVGTVRDITERRERERELERREEELRAVVESSPDPIVMKDVDGTFQLVNEARVALSERSREEFIGSKPEDIYEESVAETIRERTAAVHEAETPRTVEETYLTAEGERTFLTTRAPYYGPDGDLQGTVVLSRDITERRERERELERREEELRAVVESSPHPIVMKDRDGTYQLVNEAKVEMSGHSREELVGSKPADIYDEETAAQIREWTERVYESGEPETVEETSQTVEGERTLLTTRAPYYGPDGRMQGTVVISRDVTERKRQQDQLERLARIQQLIHESVGALTSATTQDEIERSVCERLASSPFYEFAWIGSRDPSSHEVTPENHAGIDSGYLDAITVTVDPSDSGQGPVGRAYRSGDVTVVSDVDTDPDFAPWREAALEAGFRSVAAVPLRQGSTTHGVLVVYADRPSAFSDRELAGFETLGETVGFALSAAQNRRLLESETVLELEFLTHHLDDAILDATDGTGCRFVFEGAVSSGDDATLCYLTVDGLDVDCAATTLAAAESVERYSRLDDTGGPNFEVTLRDPTYQLLADAGARGTRVVVENGVSRVFAEAPAETDVRAVRDALETAAGDAELVARREKEPSDTRWFPTRGDLGTRLTDRQRSVLRAAFYSGYYEWPRETDAEALADSLGIASSTALQHLRKGHYRVMSALFDS